MTVERVLQDIIAEHTYGAAFDKDAAIQAIAQLMPRWVSVEDGLPEAVNGVLLKLQNGVEITGYVCDGRWFALTMDHSACKQIVPDPVSWLDNCPEPPTD